MKKLITVLIFSLLLIAGINAYTLTVHVVNIDTFAPIAGAMLFRDPPEPLPNQWGPSDASGTIVVPNYQLGTYNVTHPYYLQWVPAAFHIGIVSSDLTITVYGYPDYSTVPSDPTNLTAQAYPGYQILISWDDNSDNEEGFLLERRTANTEWSVLADLPANTEQYLDSYLTPGETYYYRILAYSYFLSGYSNEDHATSTQLPEPANIQITRLASNQIQLTWSAVPSFSQYRIYAAWEPLPPTSPNWHLIGMTSNLYYTINTRSTRRFYQVRAFTIEPIWVLDWYEGFDTYTLNEFPPNWTGSGNWDEVFVSDYNCVTSPYSLSMAGVSGGNWEALVHREFESGHEYYKFNFKYYFTGQGVIGNHDYHAYISIRNQPTWTSSADRGLMGFEPNGDIYAFCGGVYHVIGTYTPGTWVNVSIEYQRASTVSLKFYLNGSLVYQGSDSPLTDEATLNYFSPTSGDTRCLYDDISVFYSD